MAVLMNGLPTLHLTHSNMPPSQFQYNKGQNNQRQRGGDSYA